MPASAKIARQVARNVAPYNIPDHETPIFKINSTLVTYCNTTAKIYIRQIFVIGGLLAE